ncbi:hypothetical protein V6N13_100199 [Hibiscus sabdariffa]
MIQFLSPEEDDEKARFWFANLLQLHAAAPNELELLHNSTLYRSRFCLELHQLFFFFLEEWSGSPLHCIALQQTQSSVLFEFSDETTLCTLLHPAPYNV